MRKCGKPLPRSTWNRLVVTKPYVYWVRKTTDFDISWLVKCFAYSQEQHRDSNAQWRGYKTSELDCFMERPDHQFFLCIETPFLLLCRPGEMKDTVWIRAKRIRSHIQKDIVFSLWNQRIANHGTQCFLINWQRPCIPGLDFFCDGKSLKTSGTTLSIWQKLKMVQFRVSLTCSISGFLI